MFLCGSGPCPRFAAILKLCEAQSRWQARSHMGDWRIRCCQLPGFQVPSTTIPVTGPAPQTILPAMNSVELASLFKALSEPIRVRVMALLLSRDELCVCDLVEALALPQSVVSRHLAYLRNHDLVSAARRGVWMYYRISDTARSSLTPLLAMLEPSGELGIELKASLTRLQQDNCCA